MRDAAFRRERDLFTAFFKTFSAVCIEFVDAVRAGHALAVIA